MNAWLLMAQADDGAFFVGGAMLLVGALVALVMFVIWVWALISAIQNPALDSTMRIVWILVIIFTGIIGAIIYLLMKPSSTAADEVRYR